jgi:hypothetical protein
VWLFLAEFDVGIDGLKSEIPVPDCGLNLDIFYFEDRDAGSISPDRMPVNVLSLCHRFFFLSWLWASA